MSSFEIMKIWKRIFDELVCQFELTEERVKTFIEMIEDDEELNDRHYESLRRYALQKAFECGV